MDLKNIGNPTKELVNSVEFPFSAVAEFPIVFRVLLSKYLVMLSEIRWRLKILKFS